ncbi:DUF1627 domain-containing protein [Escherichia coli]|nr:DUF1627 domain-containing protein [Escherichia coli]EHP9630119.1 DUF1627 domain-containing protein [Escherichia coli]EHP9640428.1 DUF1627 domain-containing protein [Escherichia coli]EHP9645686.1 DUF1627 domain-containing protein [Escherichia coli]EHP9685998.1 DUF1627 domain-containing protein [Escherichia coli]
MSKLSEEACDVLECLMASGRNSARGVAEVLQMSPAMVIEILKKLEAEGLVTQLNGFWSVPEEKTPEVKMESVVDALKAMGKATSVELAARLQVSREEVLNELWELRQGGVVEQNSHVWMLVSDGAKKEQKTSAAVQKQDNGRKPREVVSRQEREPLNREEIINALKQSGELTTTDIATAVGRGDCARALVPAMEKLCRDGLVVKLGQGRGCKWKLVKQSGENLPAKPEAASAAETDGKSFPQPAGVALPVQEAATQEDIKTETEEDIKTETEEDIEHSQTSLTGTRADDLIFPSLRRANLALRRAKSDVQKWERVCAALRELNKCRDILRDITATREQQR